jgi:glycine/D-amino acid oxidase-like deaminating enzyme
VKPVVVVGAGIVGASIAYHLSSAGVPVTVIGRDAGVTASSFAWIGGPGGDWPGGAADLSGLVLGDWRRLERQVPSVGVRWTGSLRWPVPSEHTAPGLVGPQVVASLEPHLRTFPEKAIHAPADGGVDPAVAARQLLLAAQILGARIRYGVTVRRVRADGVESSAGFQPAAATVLAAGAGTAALARQIADPDHQHTARQPWNETSTASRIGRTDPALLVSVRTRQAGLVRGIVATPQLEVREVRERKLLVAAQITDASSWAEHRETAHRAVRTLRWTFGDGDLVGWRVGTRPMPTGGPVIGRLTPHTYVAVMHSAVCLAPSVGRLVASEIVSGAPAPQLTRCRPAR